MEPAKCGTLEVRGGEKGFLSMEEWWDSLFGHNGDLDSLSKSSATILKNVG